MVNPITLSEPILGKDIKLVVSGSRAKEVQQVLENRARMLGRVRSYEFKGGLDSRGSRSRFNPPIYDLAEVARAADVEPYINQSIRKHREQILKEGYQISGSDEEMVAYVKHRLFEISVLTGITTEQWLREVVTNLITYHNALIVFKRDSNRSSGKPITMYGSQREPIAGIFVGDPTSIEVSVDKWGTPKKWKQNIQGNSDSEVTASKTYNPEDVILITVDKKTGFTFGTPYLLSVLDDIRALRKLEEVAIIVSCKEAFPLYHYKVGTENRPAIAYEGGDNEINQVLGDVANLPSQGYIVTSERHEVKLISKDGGSLDLSPYMAYFEARVIAGLRLSPLDLGRGGTANRGTATNINKGLQDSAKDYQMVLSDHITNFLILPLLLEGSFDVTEENLVKFTFPTIDREEERAAQNHGLQLHMGNAISTTEFRKQYLNKQPMSEEDKADSALRTQTEAQKEIVRAQGAARASASSGSDLGVSKVANQIKNKGQPANQHGSKTKSRHKANDYSAKLKDKFVSVKSNILTLIEDPNFDSTILEDIFRDFVKQMVEASRGFIEDCISEGSTKANKEYNTLNPDNDFEFEEVGSRAIDRFFVNFVTKSFWKVINPYKDQIISLLHKDSDNNIDITKIIACLEVLDKSLNILTVDQTITAERFGFIKFAKKVGSKTIELVNPDNLESSTLDISDMVYKNFIPSIDNQNHYLSFNKTQE